MALGSLGSGPAMGTVPNPKDTIVLKIRRGSDIRSYTSSLKKKEVFFNEWLQAGNM